MNRIINIAIFLICLTICLSPQQEPTKKRILDVKLVFDASLTKTDKPILFKKAIARVSKDFEEQFALAFSIKTSEIWKNPYKKKPVDSLIHFFYNKVTKEEADIVIGFVSSKKRSGPYGVSIFEEGYVLLRCINNTAFLEKVLAHEIAHLFGAAHVSDNTSLMHHFILGDRIDKINRSIINLHRERKFKVSGFPLSTKICEKVLPLYQEIVRSNEESNRLDKQGKILETGKGLENVYTYLAMVYIQLGKYRLALDVCEKALKMKPDLYESYNFMGIASRRSGEYDKAIQYYHKVIKINPYCRRIHYNLGVAYMKRGDEDLALASYSKALEYNPNFSDAYNNRGYIFLERKDFLRAISEFKKALDANPFHSLARSNLAEALLRKGEIEQAHVEIEKAINLDPELPGAHSILGMIWSGKNDLFKAEKEYKRAISLLPSYYKAYYNLGNLYFKKKDIPGAAPYYKKVIEINPKFAAAYSALGDCYFCQGKYIEAEKVYKKGILLDSLDGRLHNNLAVTYYLLKDYKKAEKHLNEAEDLGIKVDNEFKKALQKALDDGLF